MVNCDCARVSLVFGACGYCLWVGWFLGFEFVWWLGLDFGASWFVLVVYCDFAVVINSVVTYYSLWFVFVV